MYFQIFVLSLFIFIFSLPAEACSFAPRLERFHVDQNAEVAGLPVKTEFRLQSLTRGYDDRRPGSCSDAGQMTLQALNMPQDTGFVFEVVAGSFPDDIFSPEAVKPVQYVEHNEFGFVWFDLAQGQPQPIDTVVSITPVARDGTRGEPFLLTLRNDGENYQAPDDSRAQTQRSWWCRLTFGWLCAS